MYSLQYRLMVKLSTPLSIEAHVPSAILIRILKRDPLAIRLNKLKFKVLHNRELLHCDAEVSPVEECFVQ